MATQIRTQMSTNQVQGSHPEPVELNISRDPGVFVGDDVTLVTGDGDVFLTTVADIEEDRGKIYLDLR